MALLLLQAEQYRGEADPSQDLLTFALRTTTLWQQQEQQQTAVSGQPVVPYLPSGSIVSGLAAALLTQAELADVPAELLVVVEQVPSLVPETLQQLGQLVAAGGSRVVATTDDSCTREISCIHVDIAP